MSDKFGMLGTIFVSAIDPFPVNVSLDQIGIELKKEDIPKLIDRLNEILKDNQDLSRTLVTARVRLQGKFSLEHEGTERLKTVEERFDELKRRL